MDTSIDKLLEAHPYRTSAKDFEFDLLALLRNAVIDAAARLPSYGRYVGTWPIPPQRARVVSDLPFLPVRMFKADPPLSLVATSEIKRFLSSSATTGQAPSRVVLDTVTSRRMTKGVTAIVADYVGTERRPYLVVDLAAIAASPSLDLGARGAAIRGLQPFARETLYCLRQTDTGIELDRPALLEFADRHRDKDVLVYGFTYMLWLHFAKPLAQQQICLNMPHVHVMHSGGWKRLVEDQVGKDVFNQTLAAVFGCGPERVIDFYGMVENLGIIYPDCEFGNKHAPTFGEVIVRDPLTLTPVSAGETGIVQVCSVLPNSFPGHLLLTEDMAKVVLDDGCSCGRSGLAFRFSGRVPKTEVRGCGNVAARRNEEVANQ